MRRRVEAAAGLMTGAAGIMGCAYAAFGPTYRYVGSSVSSGGRATLMTGSTSLMHRGLGTPAAVYLAAMLLAAIGCAACAYLHSRRGTRAALTFLWLLTAVLCAGVALGAASLGILLAPAAPLAAVTSAVGSLTAAGSAP